MDIINEFHKQHRKDSEELRGYREPIAAIECNDGFRISVQASQHSYCRPRITDDIEYDKFECGFPSGPVPELREWKEGDDEVDDTATIFAYVPVAAIVKLVENHGGIKGPFRYEPKAT